MIDLFIKGGPLMYPLLLCSVISLGVILERGIILLRAKTRGAAIEEIKENAQKGAVEAANAAAKKLSRPVSTIVLEALKNAGQKRGEVKNREGIESRLSLVGSVELKKLARHIHYLELIGKIAPMLGLSGTVLGLARTFQTVAVVEGFADPGILASGIWEALITTVVGLFIGIPALIFYHLYDNRIRSIAYQMRTVGEELLTILGDEG